jgi:hypothetical protein
MSAQSNEMEQGFFSGPLWPEDNTSDFGPDPSGSSALSSNIDTVVSDDLNLYDPTCVC